MLSRLAQTAALVIAVSGCAELDASLREVESDLRELFAAEKPPERDTVDPRAADAHEQARRAREAGEHAAEVARLREAAELGHARAAYELGVAYTRGRGVPVDLEAGARWINRAAELGDASAEFLVGSTLYSGTGVERDIPRGVALLERAADQGHARAQFLLGQIYVDGAGVTKDPAWAARRYGQAALAGHVRAQYAYGIMFASGLGVPKDLPRAYEWLSLAEAGGDARAVLLLAKIRGELTAQEIAAAQGRADRFRLASSAGIENAPTVMFVQQRLDELGFRVGPLDGIAGPRTRAAIRAYQTTSRLDVDGELSPALVERLRESGG
ncbi:MAG: SEL1-like repeat protein [Gammaproteobacteria bacterium]|nr:SEL1-like repeat protein [Gammaproteobacteria bacterium]